MAWMATYMETCAALMGHTQVPYRWNFLDWDGAVESLPPALQGGLGRPFSVFGQPQSVSERAAHSQELKVPPPPTAPSPLVAPQPERLVSAINEVPIAEISALAPFSGTARGTPAQWGHMRNVMPWLQFKQKHAYLAPAMPAQYPSELQGGGCFLAAAAHSVGPPCHDGVGSTGAAGGRLVALFVPPARREVIECHPHARVARHAHGGGV